MKLLRPFLLSVLVPALVACASHPVPPTQPAPVAAAATGLAHARDTLVLADGRTVSGTILELAPGGDVLLLTDDRRVLRIPRERTVRAGPGNVTFAPGLSPDASCSRHIAKGGTCGTWVRLHFTSSEAGTRLLRRLPSLQAGSHPSYEAVCTAPCDVLLPAGSYRFAIARASSDPVVFPERTPVRRPLDMQVRCRSHAGERTAGTLIGVVAVGVGLSGWLDAGDGEGCPYAGPGCSGGSGSDTRIVTSTLLLVGGAVLGLALGTQSDEINVSFSPLSVVPDR